MFAGKFVFKNARLCKIVISSLELNRKGLNYKYGFRRDCFGAYLLCQLGNITYQPTNVNVSSSFREHIADNEFCRAHINKDMLVLKIKNPFRFNPFLVLNNEYVNEWGRLYNGLNLTLSLLFGSKATLHGGIEYRPDSEYAASLVLDALFKRALDPVNTPYLERLVKDVCVDDFDIERYTLKGIVSSCLFQVTLKNILSYIKAMQK